MTAVTAGLVAALAAYVINRILIIKTGNKAIAGIIPFVEELLKSGVPYLLGEPIYVAHAVFGLSEAVYEIVTGRATESRSGAVLSLLSHTLFGLLTMYLFSLSGSFLAAVLAVSVVHGLWNNLVVQVYTR